MAGIAKPDIPKLGIEGKITFLEYNTAGNFESIDTLLDGDTAKHNVYGVLLTHYSDNIIFEIHQKSNIYAFGQRYSDSGGYTPMNVNLYKKVGDNYELVKSSIPTKEYVWYLLFENLEHGVYKLVRQGNYVMFTEWYVENLEPYKYLLKHDNYNYSIKSGNYLEGSYKPLGSEIDIKLKENEIFMENDTQNYFKQVVIENETFRPIDKFNKFNLLIKKGVVI